MMNVLQLQDSLRGLSESQLVSEMQSPSGNVPQFLVLSEMTRRKKVRDDYSKRMSDQSKTVAEDAIVGAGVPQGGIAAMAQSMAPRTDMAMNTGAAPMGMAAGPTPPAPDAELQGMRDGGLIRFQQGGQVGDKTVIYYGKQYRISPDGQITGVDTGRSITDERERAAIAAMQNPETAMIPQGVRPITGDEISEGVEPGGFNTMLYEGIMGSPAIAEEADSMLEGGQIDQRQYDALTRGSVGAKKNAIRSIVNDAPMDTYGSPALPKDGPVIAGPSGAPVEGAPSLEEGPNIVPPPAIEMAEEDPEAPPNPLLSGVLAYDKEAGVEGAKPTAAPAAAPAGGGGGASGGYSSYEQYIQSQLDALTKDKEREKWMAVALAGAQLMSSDNPTFGGAVGEAFQTGLGYFGQSQRDVRDREMELMGIKYNVANARAKAAKG